MTVCSRPRDCCCCGHADTSSRSRRRRARATSPRSRCSRCASRSAASATTCGASGGTVCRSSTSTPRRSSTGSSSQATSTPTAECSSSAPRPSARYGHGTSWTSSPSSRRTPSSQSLQGRQELGKVDPIVLTRKVDGPRIIVLAARSWEVTYIDWKRQRCYVEPADNAREDAVDGRRRTAQLRAGPSGAGRAARRRSRSHDLEAGDRSSWRRSGRITTSRSRRGAWSFSGRDDVWWWTWAGARANATLIAGLPGIADDSQRPDNFRVRSAGDEAAAKLGARLVRSTGRPFFQRSRLRRWRA